LAQDQVAAKIAVAQAAEKEEDWRAAATAYADALSLLPAGNSTARNQLQLAHANARMYAGELPEAILELEGLLADMLKGGSAASSVREVRGLLASAQYYAGWLMRLEGATAVEWTAETEQARQNFRLLAEETQKQPDLRLDYQKNLEAT